MLLHNGLSPAKHWMKIKLYVLYRFWCQLPQYNFLLILVQVVTDFLDHINPLKDFLFLKVEKYVPLLFS